MLKSLFEFLESLKNWRLVNLATVLFFLLIFYSLYDYKELITREIEMQRDKDVIIHRVEPDLFVNQSLDELRKKFSADRALIFRFHNGQTYFDGKHKIRMSCEYETVGEGIKPVSLELQNLPASLFSWYINQVKNDNFRYLDVEDIPDINTRVGLKSQGVSSVVSIPYLVDSQLVAIVNLSWVGNRANMAQILENLDLNKWESDKLYEISKNDAIEIGKILHYENFENKEDKEERDSDYRRIFIGG